MKPAAFEYVVANSIEQAVAVLAQAGGDAKILAGGQSLVPMLNFRLLRPAILVDINRIPDLAFIEDVGDAVKIGALTRHHQLETSPVIAKHFPILSYAMTHVAHLAIRNRGTIGGSLAHADPAADWPAMVLAADANIEVQGANGRRLIKATDFFTGLFSTSLQENEIITAIRIPVPPDGTHSTYQKFSQPASRFALAGCAVMRFPNGKTNIAFTGVSENAFRDADAENVASGKTLGSDTIAAAVDAALQDVTILSDHYASEDYRRHLAKVYLKKALMAVA